MFSLTPLAALALDCRFLPGQRLPRAPNYHLMQKVVLGGEGGWDYLRWTPTPGGFISAGAHM